MTTPFDRAFNYIQTAPSVILQDCLVLGARHAAAIHAAQLGDERVTEHDFLGAIRVRFESELDPDDLVECGGPVEVDCGW